MDLKNIEIKELLEVIVKFIVQTEDDVHITESHGEVLHGKESVHYKIKCNSQEFSLLIGRDGSTIKSLRMLFSKIGGKRRQSIYIDTDEEKK